MQCLSSLARRFGKSGIRRIPQAHKLHTDHDMAQKLAVVGVIVGRKGGKFLGFSNIMKHGRRDEEVSVQEIILVRIEIAEFYHA